MKHVAVVYSGGRHWGGIETYLANLFRLYDRAQMRLLLVSLGDWDLTRELAQQGLAGDTRILSGKRVSLKTVAELRRLIEAERVGLIVSQGVVANAYGRLAARLAGVPDLTVVHSDLDLDYPHRLTRTMYKFSDRVLRRWTGSYVAVSQHLKRRLVGSGVRPGMIRVIYNGVATPTEAPRACGASVDALDADDGTPTKKHDGAAQRGRPVSIVSAGRLHPVKNFDSLVKAVALLTDPVRLTIWGEGDERQQLESLVQSLEMGDRVCFPGKSENMEQVLRGADVYVQSSWSEGCSFAVAEAMLQGKPVIVAPYGGLPEQVEDRTTGLVSKDGSPAGLAEALSVLVADETLRRRLGSAGRKAAEEMYALDKWLSETTVAFCDAAEEAVHSA